MGNSRAKGRGTEDCGLADSGQGAALSCPGTLSSLGPPGPADHTHTPALHHPCPAKAKCPKGLGSSRTGHWGRGAAGQDTGGEHGNRGERRPRFGEERVRLAGGPCRTGRSMSRPWRGPRRALGLPVARPPASELGTARWTPARWVPSTAGPRRDEPSGREGDRSQPRRRRPGSCTQPRDGGGGPGARAPPINRPRSNSRPGPANGARRAGTRGPANRSAGRV